MYGWIPKLARGPPGNLLHPMGEMSANMSPGLKNATPKPGNRGTSGCNNYLMAIKIGLYVFIMNLRALVSY